MGVAATCSRRDFLKLILPASAIILGIPEPVYGQESVKNTQKLEEIARREAQDFISSIPNELSEIEKVALSYDVYMRCKHGIVLKATTKLSMQRNGNEYQATVGITEPEPQTDWSWLLMTFIGKNTREYKDLVRATKLRISETFFLDKTYKTKVFKQEMLQNDSESKTIKVEFDYKNREARLFKDEGDDIPKIPLDCQTGPMTGYFNLLFFPKTRRMTIIKPQRQVNGDGVEYVFRNEDVHFTKDNFTYRPVFNKGSLFEAIEGGVAYDTIENDRTLVPYIIRIDSVISKKRRNNQERKIRELDMMEPRPSDYEDTRKRILAEDVHAARDVRAFLTRAHVS
ncbi:MAG: hypothetical protein V1645_00930 [archaeon]